MSRRPKAAPQQRRANIATSIRGAAFATGALDYHAPAAPVSVTPALRVERE
jgi:hypothetical protein